MNLKRTCTECNRVFDLTDAIDADEWTSGHDCEPPTIVGSMGTADADAQAAQWWYENGPG